MKSRQSRCERMRLLYLQSCTLRVVTGIVASIQRSTHTLNLWRYEFRVVLPKQGLRWRLGESPAERLEDGSVLWHGIITRQSPSANLLIKSAIDFLILLNSV